MELLDVPLLIALVTTLLLNGPQLQRTLATRDVNGFSVATIALRVAANTAWIVYAGLTHNVLLGLPSVVNALSESALLGMVICFRSPLPEEREKTAAI